MNISRINPSIGFTSIPIAISNSTFIPSERINAIYGCSSHIDHSPKSELIIGDKRVKVDLPVSTLLELANKAQSSKPNGCVMDIYTGEMVPFNEVNRIKEPTTIW